MADESTTTSGDATQSTTDQHDGDDDEGDPIQDANKLLETLRKERTARKAAERELKPLRTYKQQTEDAAKTDQERRDERIAELEGQISKAQERERSYALRDAIEEALTTEKVALVAPVGRLLRLIDADDVQWTEGGEPRNVPALLRSLAKSDPYLFEVRRGPSGDGGKGREAVGATMNDMIRRAAGR